MIEIPSANECDQASTDMQPVLDDMLIEYAIRGCVEEGFEAYMSVSTQFPLSKAGSSGSLFYINASPVEGEQFRGRVLVTLGLDLDQYDRLNDRMYNEFFDMIDLVASRIVLEVNNDERAPVNIVVIGSFLDGQPVHVQQSTAIEFRNVAQIELSNVGNAAVENYGLVYPLIVDFPVSDGE